MEELTWWRADSNRWTALDYAETTDSDDTPEDANLEARAAVLDLLARDRGDDDIEFLRHLLRQEIAMHEASWGYSNSLGLASLLVVEQGVVNDVWLLWEAKSTNFDTFCGLDGPVLFGAGVKETLAFVTAADHPERDSLLEYLIDDTPTDEMVAGTLQWLREYLVA